MTNNGVEQKPSDTALFAALRRTIANKEYNNDKFGPDFLAKQFLPPHFRFFLRFKRIRANTKNKLNEALPGLNEYMIARTAHFDRLFVDALKDKTPQIVLLGAGYESRAYRFAKSNHATRIFELNILSLSFYISSRGKNFATPQRAAPPNKKTGSCKKSPKNGSDSAVSIN